VGPRASTATTIVAAARLTIAERGSGKLSLSAVAARAGVSRPTLYRWFPTRDHLLEAVAAEEEQEFYAGMRIAIDAHRGPARQLDAALHYLVLYLDGSQDSDPIGVDLEFVVLGFRRILPTQVETLAAVLGDSLTQVPAVRAGALTCAQAAELFLRLAYSHYLLPHPDPEMLLANIRAFAGLRRSAATRAVGRRPVA
jgi:AcrR family transcriptional regulator